MLKPVLLVPLCFSWRLWDFGVFSDLCFTTGKRYFNTTVIYIYIYIYINTCILGRTYSVERSIHLIEEHWLLIYIYIYIYCLSVALHMKSRHLCNSKSEQKCFYLLGTDYISEQFFQRPRTWTNSSKGKSDLVADPDQQYKNSLKIEGIKLGWLDS